MKGQCFRCIFRLFFKPLPDSTFSCCEEQNETVEDIDLKSGVSPVIQLHGIEGKLCSFHIPGPSKFEPLEDRPFEVCPERIEGEKRLKEVLKIK